MDKQQFAELLTGRQYGDEITKDECLLAEQNGLLIAFGCSDDLLEVRGAIDDEYSAWYGTIVGFCKDKDGSLFPLEREDIDLIKKVGIPLLQIEACWNPSAINAPWLIKANIESSSFDIFEDDRLFCRGIVVDCNDVKYPIANPST